MPLAQSRRSFGKQGGRFVVSEGVAPAEALLPHDALPTLRVDPLDVRFETVIVRGTVLSVIQYPDGNSRIVPANGSGSVSSDNAATPLNIQVPGNSTVIGVAQYDLYRPFDKGTSQISGWLTHGYVEYPMVQGLNDDLAPGNLVYADALGRPVSAATVSLAEGDFPQCIVGKVIVVEKFATNYDYGMLQYMQLPADPGILRDLLSITQSGPYQGLFGVRANLDVPAAVGAFRVLLTI